MNLVKRSFEKIDLFFYFFSIFCLPLSIKLSSKFLFLSLVLGSLKSIYSKNFNWFSKQNPITFIYSIFLVFICVQGIVFLGYESFFKLFERYYAPYLIFILAPLFYRDFSKIRYIPKIFISGVFFVFFLIITKSIIQLDLYDRTKVLEVFDIHHLYISLYILFAINYLLANIFLSEIKGDSKIKIILIFILGAFLFLFKSKAAIVIALFLLVYYSISKIRWNTIRLTIATVFFVLLIVVFNSFFLRIYISALDFRSKIWGVAIECVLQRPVFGYGSFSEHGLLNNGHFINGNYDFLDSDLNTHNQFLTFLLKFGLIGLTLTVSTFVIPLFRMKTKLKMEYMGFLILVFSMAFIESLFNRHHGIVFCTVFLYYYNTKAQMDSLCI